MWKLQPAANVPRVASVKRRGSHSAAWRRGLLRPNAVEAGLRIILISNTSTMIITTIVTIVIIVASLSF
jgi:hypothetical protein